MNITHLLSVDMARRMPVMPVDAVQGDGSTRVLKLSLLENGAQWPVPQNVTAAVAFRKPDGTKGLYDTLPDGTCAVTLEGNTVSAILAPQVLTCPGEVAVSVAFYDDQLNQLAAFPVSVRVAANPGAGQGISNDYYRYRTMAEVSEAVEAALTSFQTGLEDMTPVIVCEKTGMVIAVTDAADRPVKGLALYGKTIQNGTPTPSAPVALESVGEAIRVTVAGKNLLPYPYTEMSKTKQGVTYTANADGGVAVSGTATGYSDLALANIDVGWVKDCITITALGDFANILLVVNLKDSEGNIIGTNDTTSSRMVNISEYPNAKTLDIRIKRASDATVGGTMYPMVTVGKEAPTAYEIYKPLQTLTATAEGGLHGIGEVKDEIDFARGVRVQRCIKTSNFRQSGEEAGFKRYTLSLTDTPIIRELNGKLNVTDVWSTAGYEYGAAHWFINSNGTAIYVFLPSDYDIDANPIEFLGALVTPIETPLAESELAAFAALHSNKPNTTAFNDAGADMKLSYVADTKSYIDQKLAAISAAMLA